MKQRQPRYFQNIDRSTTGRVKNQFRHRNKKSVVDKTQNAAPGLAAVPDYQRAQIYVSPHRPTPGACWEIWGTWTMVCSRCQIYLELIKRQRGIKPNFWYARQFQAEE
jgi:hypothetical protein